MCMHTTLHIELVTFSDENEVCLHLANTAACTLMSALKVQRTRYFLHISSADVCSHSDLALHEVQHRISQALQDLWHSNPVLKVTSNACKHQRTGPPRICRNSRAATSTRMRTV